MADRRVEVFLEAYRAIAEMVGASCNPQDIAEWAVRIVEAKPPPKEDECSE